MAWKKNTPDAVRRFHEYVSVPGATAGIMFGCPVLTLGDERYAVLQANRIALRLAPADAAELLDLGGKRWEPTRGRPSKDKVVVPDEIAANARSLRTWVRKAVRYARGE